MKNNNEIKDSKKAKCIRLIAEMLEGLQFPVSASGAPAIFGTALAPYVELLQILNVNDFQDQSFFINKLESVIK